MGKDRLKIVGLGGSLAQHSTSLAALRVALATKLGLPARTLDSKLKRFKINKYRFKVPRAS
jgi:hypothetical protein